jgi:hypothetical protein
MATANVIPEEIAVETFPQKDPSAADKQANVRRALVPTFRPPANCSRGQV